MIFMRLKWIKWVVLLMIPLLLFVTLWGIGQEKRKRVSTIALLQEMNEQQPDFNKVKLLVDRGADVNKRGKHNDAPLRLAIGEGVPLVKLLLENGADVNAQNDWGATALTRAASYGSVTYVRLMLDAGAHVNTRDAKGHTALWEVRRMMAITRDSDKLVSYPPNYKSDLTNYLNVEQILIKAGGVE